MASRRDVDLVKLRDRIEVLRRKIDATTDMCVPIARAIERANEMVDDLAESGAIAGHVFAHADYSRPSLDYPRDIVQFLAWVTPEAMKSRMRQSIEDFYREYAGTIDSPATHATLQEDRAALFKLEVEEERLIVAAAAEGVPLTRRANADPRAVLTA